MLLLNIAFWVVTSVLVGMMIMGFVGKLLKD